MRAEIVTGHETPFPRDRYFTARSLSKRTDVNNPFACVNFGPLLFALPIADDTPDQPHAGVPFNFALDVAALREIQVERHPTPQPWRWQLDAPIKLRVPARQFDWQPTELQPLPPAPVNTGRAATITLVPYGCTKFRVSMFPLTTRTERTAARD